MRGLILAIVLVPLSIFSAAGQTGQGTKQGAIQSVKVERARIADQSGVPLAKPRKIFSELEYGTKGDLIASHIFREDGSFDRRFSAVYDSSGRETEVTYLSEKGSVLIKAIYSYDAGGHLIEIVWTDSKSSPAGRKIVRRDAAGRAAEVIRYDNKGREDEHYSYKYLDGEHTVETEFAETKKTRAHRDVDAYDSAGRLKSSTTYDQKGALISRVVRGYDNRGNLIEERHQDTSGLSVWRYSYEFDSNGNWTKQIMSRLINVPGRLAYQPTDVTSRTITYYTSANAVSQTEDSNLGEHIERHQRELALNGTATKLPKPVYPERAGTAYFEGTVVVQVLIDEDGAVLSAQSLEGPALLREAAENAAWFATFTPTLSGGELTRVSGTINFNFKR